MEEASNRKVLILSYVASSIAILISLLQGWFFVLDGHWSFYNIAAIGLAVATIFFTILFIHKKSTELLARVILLYCGQLAFLIVKLLDIEPTAAPRLLEVALILLHGATIVSAAIARLDVFVWPKNMMVCVPIVLLIFAGEMYFPSSKVFAPPPKRGLSGWTDAGIYHPTLAMVYRPHSSHVDYFTQNPGNYFMRANDVKNQWWFRTGVNAKAEAIYSDNANAVRVNINNAGNKTPYDIQLNLTKLNATSGQKYRIQFRAKADAARNIFVGFARSHDPWTGLGLYKKLGLTSEWQTFTADFQANDTDGNARIHFDLGESGVPVEFSSVQLLNLPEAKPLESNETKFSVEYRFNNMGCRGPDYAIPKPSGTKRILVLGDLSTLGAGVNEDDTFSARIQRALNEQVSNTEVINCGIDEYGVQQNRLFYKFYGVEYKPDLVLLVLSRNANASVLEELNPRGPLFYTWARIRKYFRPFDFDTALDETIQLNQRLRNDGAKFGVVAFRDRSDFEGATRRGKHWNQLTKTMQNHLSKEKIPFLDLGSALYSKHSEQDLMVLPKIDPHPNHIAHEIAAEELLNFIESENLLKN